MMIYTPLLRAICALSLVAGVLGTVNVTSPNSATTLSAGVLSRVTWTDSGKAPTLKEFGAARISLCAGNDEKQSVLQVLASSVDVSDKSSAEFTVNAKVGPDSDLYLLRFDSLNSKNVAFSQNFKLTNMTGMFTTSPQPTSGSGSSKPSSSTKPASGSVSGTLTAPPSTFTGTDISGNSSTTDGLNVTVSGNATATLPAPCPNCVNITVVVLVTTAHDSATPTPTRSAALSIVHNVSLSRLGAFLAIFAAPFALLA